MPTIFELKEQAVTETPLLLFDCALTDGRVERWSTHRVQNAGHTYEARVLRHNVFEIQAASDQGVEGVPRISLALANADSHFSQLERSVGVKGARITATFVFYDLLSDEPASEPMVMFLGVCSPPEEITESMFRISVTNRMNMQRVLLPPVRIQRRCPWTFPATSQQRAEAMDGGEQGKYSRYYRCGYSADVPGGSGLADGSGPFTTCGYLRGDCALRGMTPHFGGVEFVPSTIQVRGYGEKGSHASGALPNEARYNDFVPLIYGTAWYTPPVVFARNDGNLTRMEVLLGMGEIDSVVKVLVNDVEIPLGRTGQNMTGTGWYNVPTLGTRQGGFNLDFVRGDGSPAGDPYGSMAYLSLVAPSRVSDGRSLPTVKALVRGLKLPVYDTDGAWLGESWSANPAWILLDVLRRSGWGPGDVDLPSFAKAAAYCDEPIETVDLYGNAISIARFGCNLVVSKRRSAGDVIRGIRNAARLFLTYGEGGRVELRAERSMAAQQPVKPAGSNSVEPLAGGWPAYEFGDGATGTSGILRRTNGEPHLRIWSRSCSETANRLTVEFQDAFNEYQQDSFSLVDVEDVERSGQETSAPAAALGIPNIDQASRVLRHQLDKAVRGNTYVEFGTSVKALGIHPGDLITVTYLKEGFERQPFRVLKIAPGQNFGTAVITAQLHYDEWYQDGNGRDTAGGRRDGGSGVGIPRPLAGSEIEEHGEVRFGVEEHLNEGGVELSVSFTGAARPAPDGPGIPLVSLAATVEGDGSLSGGRSLYYAVSGVNVNGLEGGLSFVVRATLPEGGGKSVKLKGLSFAPDTTAFHAYRGTTPALLQRIASDQTPAAEFIDSGAESQLIPAPDRDFDHANFYWRMELTPEAPVTIHSSSTVGNGAFEMEVNEYRGAVVRITRGTGAGQERPVIANTATTVTVAPAWDIAPGAGSQFAIAEGGWKFGALSATSPVRFAVPDRPGETVQVCGRAANVNDAECSPEISLVARWKIGGSGEGDAAVPPTPAFAFSPSARGGAIEVAGIAFPELANTRTIRSGTLTLYFWNEILGSPAHSLVSGIGAEEEVILLSQAAGGEPGRMLQIGTEIVKITDQPGGGSQYEVVRGLHGTSALEHAAGTAVYPLDQKTFVLPFPEDFFGSPYSGNWSYPIVLPNVRLGSAELFVTNRHGNSPCGSVNLTHGLNGGLRTLSGGQYTIQVDGFLAVDEFAAPALVVESPHAVRDVFAILGQAADSPVEVRINLDGTVYCTVTIEAGQMTSNGVDGFGMPILPAGARVSVSILSVGQTNPGRDLTVVIRL